MAQVGLPTTNEHCEIHQPPDYTISNKTNDDAGMDESAKH
jgi:hypothetical protein